MGKKKGKKSKGEGKFANLLKAGGKKLKEKMKAKGAQLEAKMKKKGMKMRAKMKEKGNELRKKMKEKVKEKSLEMKKKVREKRGVLKKRMKEKGVEMRKRMRERKEEFKAKMREGGKGWKANWKAKLKEKSKGLRAELRKKVHDTGELIKHAEDEIQKESVADVTSKLVTLRKTFEDKGWAVGKVYNDWATLMLMGLNAFTAVMALIVFGNTCAMASKLKRECLSLMLSEPVSIGFVFSCCLLLVSVAGFVGVWFNRLNIVKVHFFSTAVLAAFLFCFTVYGFVVTFRGTGTKLPEGISFKLYNLTAYSKFLQKKVADGKKWDDIRTCISEGSFCKNWDISTPEQIFAAKFSSTQLGCCAPPFVCGYAYQGGTAWKMPVFADRDKDCFLWSETGLCYGCSACKAGLLQNVKSIWYKASIINIVVIAALGLILYRTWFVMRVAGRWNSVAVTVKEAVKPKEEPEEEQSVIDIGENVQSAENQHNEEEEEELLVPAWLEEETPEEAIPKSSATDAAVGKKKKKRKKQPQQERRQGPSEPSESDEESDEESESLSTPVSGRSRIRQVRPRYKEQAREDDSWASPRQQVATSSFPQGFLAQNPLSAISPAMTPTPPMSPWLQTPQAAYLQGATIAGAQYADPSYGYLQGQQTYYQTDPYGQPMVAYDPNVQGYMQPQHPMQTQYYTQNTNQMGMLDNTQGYYIQDPSQAYNPQGYSQGYDPNQAYNTQGYNQGYDATQGYNYMQSPSQAGYMQEPSQAAGYMQDPNQTYYNQNQWQNYQY